MGTELEKFCSLTKGFHCMLKYVMYRCELLTWPESCVQMHVWLGVSHVHNGFDLTYNTSYNWTLLKNTLIVWYWFKEWIRAWFNDQIKINWGPYIRLTQIPPPLFQYLANQNQIPNPTMCTSLVSMYSQGSGQCSQAIPIWFLQLLILLLVTWAGCEVI